MSGSALATRIWLQPVKPSVNREYHPHSLKHFLHQIDQPPGFLRVWMPLPFRLLINRQCSLGKNQSLRLVALFPQANRQVVARLSSIRIISTKYALSNCEDSSIFLLCFSVIPLQHEYASHIVATRQRTAVFAS